MTDLLSHEESIIEQGKQRVDSEEEIEARHYAELLKAYIKLNKEQNRLIRLSDKSQKKLSVANAKLANFSTKLSKYFSPEVYNSLFTGELDVKVQTQRKLLTIFFSDLEGFTELTERLEPEVLTELLTHYLTEMSKISLRWGGTIDKYIGDAIMIFFGDPASKGEKADAVNCVRMAMEMVDQLAEIRAIWKDKGLALPLNARMGIHTGICTVGNFGSEDRLDYTVIGNGVNLASRLESNAKPNSILISEDTYLHVRSEINCSKNNTIKVKGVSYPVQTYKVEGLMMEQADQFGLTEHQIPGLSLILDQSKIENRALVRKKIKEVLDLLE
jgi:adenylate cyclase